MQCEANSVSCQWRSLFLLNAIAKVTVVTDTTAIQRSLQHRFSLRRVYHRDEGEFHLQAWGVHCGSIKQHHSSPHVIILLGIRDPCQLLSIIALLTRNCTTCAAMCVLHTCRWYTERAPTLLDGPRQKKISMLKIFLSMISSFWNKSSFNVMLPLTNLLVLPMPAK